MVIDMKVIGEMENMKEKVLFKINSGSRYEGDVRNDKREGKGIFYYNNGDRRMGDYFNDKPKGNQVILTKNWKIQIEKF